MHSQQLSIIEIHLVLIAYFYRRKLGVKNFKRQIVAALLKFMFVILNVKKLHERDFNKNAFESFSTVLTFRKLINEK